MVKGEASSMAMIFSGLSGMAVPIFAIYLHGQQTYLSYAWISAMGVLLGVVAMLLPYEMTGQAMDLSHS